MSVPLRIFSLFSTTLVCSISLASLKMPIQGQTLPPTLDNGQLLTQTSPENIEQQFQQGIQQFRQGKFQQALQTQQQVLNGYQRQGNEQGIADTLNELGRIYTNLSDYDQALENLEQAQEIYEELGELEGQGRTLNNLGFVHRRLGDFGLAFTLHQNALKIGENIQNEAIIGEAFHNLGLVSTGWGEYEEALEFYQQALVNRRRVGDKFDEGRTLNNIGGVYFSQGNYEEGLKFYQQALAIAREIKNRASEGRLLNNIGLIYFQTGEYLSARRFYQDAVIILEEIGDRANLGQAFTSLGIIDEQQGKYSSALNFYQQALTIAQTINDPVLEANALDNIGGVYYRWGRYFPALENYQNALTIRQEIGDKPRIADSLTNLGGVSFSLGEYEQALTSLQQALESYQEIGDRSGESYALSSIGIVYERLQRYPEALGSFQQSLTLAQEIGDVPFQGNLLNQIGSIYTTLQLYPQSLESYEQALTIFQDLGDRPGEGNVLNSLGSLYGSQNQYEEGLQYLQEAASLLESIGDQAGLGVTWSNIAYLLAEQKQPELAIIFYKRSVNVTQAIRQDIQQLSIAQQRSFTATVEDRYRRLADLLLQENRIEEAQQVLDLLKIQELQDYFRDVREQTSVNQTIPLSPTEERLLEFDDFINSSEIANRIEQLNRKTGGETVFREELLSQAQQQLQKLESPSALLYPLILQDRLELILVTADQPPLRRTVPLNWDKLLQSFRKFRRAISDKQVQGQALTAPAQQFYTWLIQPLEAELKAAGIETILYAPDGLLRYIPLGALHTGEQWLIERFAINYITASSLTNFDPESPSQLRIIAGAFTQGEYPFGTRNILMAGLPFAKQEVDDIAAIIPNTTSLVDREFIQDNIHPHLDTHNILHFATHAQFISGEPEESFIALGKGESLTLRELRDWNLNQVDLIVLSACQTALGGTDDGKEILGFGYQVQRAGADASIASLWSVDDRGTALLMTRFYQVLKLGKVRSVEALRQAQIALIQEEDNTLQGFSHPYYWAPFIFIGDGQ